MPLVSVVEPVARQVFGAQGFPPAMDARFIIILVIVIVALLLIFKSGGAQRAMHMTRTCRDCGATHPGFARFCRRCGKRL